MKCNFPIDEVDFKFKTFGTAEITIQINDKVIKDFPISKDHFKTKNTIDIGFTKKDPTDETSYATLDSFTVNSKDFTNDIKTIDYNIDVNSHANTDSKIKNNLYFGSLTHAGWGKIEIPK